MFRGRRRRRIRLYLHHHFSLNLIAEVCSCDVILFPSLIIWSLCAHFIYRIGGDGIAATVCLFVWIASHNICAVAAVYSLHSVHKGNLVSILVACARPT